MFHDSCFCNEKVHVCWLAGCLTGWLTGRGGLDWAVWLTGWPAGWLAGWLVGWLADKRLRARVCARVCVSVSLCLCVAVRRRVSVSQCLGLPILYKFLCLCDSVSPCRFVSVFLPPAVVPFLNPALEYWPGLENKKGTIFKYAQFIQSACSFLVCAPTVAGSPHHCADPMATIYLHVVLLSATRNNASTVRC